MSLNTFGRAFRFTTWGESHGPALGVVIDGCPPGVLLKAEDIQSALDRRKPGGSKFVTQRKEPDAVKILSGIFEDDRTEGPRTTGAPISLMIENVDQRSKDYADIRDKYRPGHADFTYDAKYGFRDYRGGGRSSARETAARVAAGAVAEKALGVLLPDPVWIRACLVQMGPHKIDRANFDWAQIDKNPFWCPDAEAAALWEEKLDAARKAGSSMGAVIEVVAAGVPAGLGAPVYGKLDADLASAMMSINAAKAVEIGAGMEAAALSGEENADEIRIRNGAPHFLSNKAGGVLGGISTGQELVVRFAVKPTSSILTPRRTITRGGEETEIQTKGRHDPCVGIRGVPVGAAMMALVLADHAMLHRGNVGDGHLKQRN
ncbi:chorismate synthase [Hyphococcus sp.]|uniref:chorismate synthase n=1 Tax=Hyphococcus sp. TaxID=2038636 RepID=UPI003CCC34BB